MKDKLLTLGIMGLCDVAITTAYFHIKSIINPIYQNKVALLQMNHSNIDYMAYKTLGQHVNTAFFTILLLSNIITLYIFFKGEVTNE